MDPVALWPGMMAPLSAPPSLALFLALLLWAFAARLATRILRKWWVRLRGFYCSRLPDQRMAP